MISEENKEQITPDDDGLNDVNLNEIRSTIKNLTKTVNYIQTIWFETKDQYQLTSEQMYKLHKFNQDHLTPKQGEDDDNSYEFNGVDKLTYEDVKDIFGENHHFTKSFTYDVDGITDIIKSSFADYINFIRFTKELQDTDIAYRKLLDLKEEQEMLKLAEVAVNETDPDKKAEMQKSIDQYYNVKLMNYLRNPLTDMEKKVFIDAFGDERKIKYYIDRSRDKLTQMGISQTYILEISNLEKIHLPERYHMLSNMVLLYFMRSIIHTDVANNISERSKYEYSRIIAMINALDMVIRKTGTQENIQKIKNNIMAFLDQLIEDIYAKYYPDKEILPLEITKQTDKTEENQS